MISYLLKFLAVRVFLDSDDADTAAPLQYEPVIEEASDNIEIARNTLARECGMFGHIIGSSTTPIDLSVAMASSRMQAFRPEIQEGQELIDNYKSSIPKGAMT